MGDGVILIKLSFAVAAAGGLEEGVEAGQLTIDHGEVDIHARFYQLGGDDPHGPCTLGKPTANLGNGFGEMGRAHRAREVEIVFVGRQGFENVGGNLTGIHDAEHSGAAAQLLGELLYINPLFRDFEAYTAQGVMELLSGRDYMADGFGWDTEEGCLILPLSSVGEYGLTRCAEEE